MRQNSGFAYIRQISAYFQPKTPASALKGIQEGYLPPEAYVFKTGSVQPLYEPPFDPDELERVLSRKDLDFATKLLLRKIFHQLSESPDPEITLFAAESVNLLEGRYMKSLEALQKAPETPSRFIQAAGLYYELALLNKEVPSLYRFYLEEARNQLTLAGSDDTEAVSEAFFLEQEILLGLGLLDIAEDKALETLFNRSTDPDVLFALCRISFLRKDCVRISLWARALRECCLDLPAEAQRFLESWEDIHG